MKIAVISDIHSNIYALDKVIEDIKLKNVDMVVCTGDLVGYGTRPNEVIHKIKEEKILTIMGNYDDAIGNLKIVCGCDYKDPKDAQKAGLSMYFTSYETTDENKLMITDSRGADLNNKNQTFKSIQDLTHYVVVTYHVNGDIANNVANAAIQGSDNVRNQIDTAILLYIKLFNMHKIGDDPDEGAF